MSKYDVVGKYFPPNNIEKEKYVRQETIQYITEIVYQVEKCRNYEKDLEVNLFLSLVFSSIFSGQMDGWMEACMHK